MIFWTGRQTYTAQGYLQRLWGLIYPWLVYEGISILAALIYMTFYIMTNPGLITQNDYDSYLRTLNDAVQKDYLVIAFVTCLLTIPLMFLFMHLDRKKEQRLCMSFECWTKVRPYAFVLAFFCGASVSVVFNHLLIYSGLYDLLSSGFEPVADLLYGGSFLMELLTVGVLTPLVEELIFRGLIFRRLRWYLDAKWAAVLSAVIFAVFHGNLLQGIYAFAIGLLMAFAYERFHQLLAPVTIHVGANLISVLLSETPGLQFIYESDAAFITATMIMMVVFVLSFYLILTKVTPEKIEKLPDARDRSDENNVYTV